MVVIATRKTDKEIMLSVIEYCRPYRGLCLNDLPKDWVYGDVIIEPQQDATDYYGDIPFTVWIKERELLEHHSKRRKFKVNPITIGQAIGQQDKNGKEVYLDDIVFYPPAVLRKVIWNDNRFCLKSLPGANLININYVRESVVVANVHQIKHFEN